MEIRRKKVNNNNWEFVNEFVNKRDGFNHKTTLFKNGCQWLTYSVHYINRTWESYDYQSCMRGAIYELEEQQMARYFDDYKYNNNISRFRKGEKDKVIASFKETPIAKEIEVLKQAIENKDFD